MDECSVIDIFCGVGGLTHGFVLEDFRVIAGLDSDANCSYAYEKNNRATFICQKVENVTPQQIINLYPEGHIKILVGCAPCQPYSKYTKKSGVKDPKWQLLHSFADLIDAVKPEIVSMENVPELVKYDKGIVYNKFVKQLKEAGYALSTYKVFCPDYGIPQNRTRLVLFASKFGEISLIEKTHLPEAYKTVKETIEKLPALKAGGQSAKDKLHKASGLSKLNLKRIKASIPGGSWKDWDEHLIAECHKKETGKTYSSVYGRMRWDAPAPTITTQFTGFGNGRFGHPEQNRGISLREGALFQTFPLDYEFLAPQEEVALGNLARQIGNAVPVDLGRAIAKSIKNHLEKHNV